MRTELISIATDTLPLDGAFYLPESEPCGAVILFHGNTMNFYVGAPRFLPPVLTGLGFACLDGSAEPRSPARQDKHASGWADSKVGPSRQLGPLGETEEARPGVAPSRRELARDALRNF
jgi:hypothetical protein